MSAIRRLFSKFGLSAVVLALLVFVFSLGGTQQVQAASDDVGVTTHRGGVYGHLVRIRKAKADPMLKSSAVPVGNNSTAEPTGTTPGRVSVYNVGTGNWSGLARVWTKKAGAKYFSAQTWTASVDAGDPLHFNLIYWGASYRFELFEDTNSNGVIDRGDKRVRYYKISTSRGWARRHMWTTHQFDVVVTGSGSGGGNPPPTTTYPKGSIVSINGLQGQVNTRIDYTVGANTLAYAYPNVAYQNWSYESFPSWYTNPATQVVEKYYWGSGATQTKTVSAPMSATAEPTVTTFTGP